MWSGAVTEWIRRLLGAASLPRTKPRPEARQAQASYDAARRELERRRARLDAALALEGLVEDMKEVRGE